MSLTPGSRIGPYAVISTLGAGGMGEVYRARDTKLDRDVALKILPDAFASDPERLARFEREAKTLASLNHPHIAQIYGFEDRALVMELVEGEDLAQRLARGPLPLAEALAIAKQIADALEAAHEQGVVHRDLKPANIKVRPDGTVKVLDFGLAKALARDDQQPDLSQSPTITGDGTRAGVLLGTVAYMSPEQARGRVVDKRADIWAFGCVLYEMLTGRSAFGRDTVSDTIARILEHEPDWTLLPPAIPSGVRRLLRRCLEKDSKRRVRDIGDARADMEDLPLDEPVVPATTSRSRAVSVIGWIVALIAVAAAVFVWRSGRTPETAGLGQMAIERLTYDSGLTVDPALSVDGRLLAYASDRSGRPDLDLYVQQTDGGTPVRVTDDPAEDRDPHFSPDGNQIAFRSERNRPGIYLVPALGGPVRLLVPDGRRPRFSPDGTRIAYWSGQFRGNPSGTASQAFVLSLAGGTPVQVAQDFVVARDCVWSPDGRSLLILGRANRTAPIAETFDWWWVPLDGRPPVRTGALDLLDWRNRAQREINLAVGTWDDAGVVFADEGSLWSLPLDPSSGKITGTPVRLALGAGSYRRPSTSRTGQIVFAETAAQRLVERVPFNTAAAAEPLVLHADSNEGARRASQTRDGSIIVYERNAEQRTEIWRKNVVTRQQELILTVDTAASVNATTSGDGSLVAYTVPDADRQSVTVNGRGYVVETAGGVPRPICENCGIYHFLADNRRTVVNRGSSRIELVDVANNNATQPIIVTEGALDRPNVSPDDRSIAYRLTLGTTAKIWVTRVPRPGEPPASRDTSQQIQEPTTTGRPAGWSPDSRILYLLLDSDGFRCLWGQRVDQAGRLSGTPFPARHFHDRRGANNISTSLGNAISPEGFLYETSTTLGTLWRLVTK